jgi:hypothetical protein
MNSSNLVLEGAVDEAVTREGTHAAEIWGHYGGFKHLAAAACHFFVSGLYLFKIIYIYIYIYMYIFFGGRGFNLRHRQGLHELQRACRGFAM